MHSPQESIPYLGLSLVTLALSLWLLYFEPEDTSAPFELKGPPDHYIKGLSHTAYSADGARTYAIQAASLD
jgi:lipopolysaccharide export system protein LptC